MELFQGNNFMYNKLVEFVSSKLTGKKSSDKAHWEMRELPEVWKELTAGTPKAKAFEKMVE